MRTNLLRSAMLGLVLLTTSRASQAALLSLDGVSWPFRESGGKDHYRMVLITSGDVTTPSVLRQWANWQVTAQAKGDWPFPVAIDANTDGTPRIDVSNGAITLHLIFGPGLDPRLYTWRVLFTGDHLNEVIGPKTLVTNTFDFAKGKDDADLYAFGSWLAAHGSAPIWSVDAKANKTWELTSASDGGGWWDGGLQGTITANQGVTPPVAKTSLQFDSVTVGGMVRNTAPVDKSTVLSAWQFDLPVNGEFSKDTGLIDVVGGVHAEAVLKPVGPFAVYPWAGYEVGKPARKPDKLFDQTVDLTEWSWVSRAVGGAIVEFYVFKSDLTLPDPKLVTLDLSATWRAPLVAEPFAELQTVNGQKVTVTTLKKNVRADIQLSVAWNLGDLFAAQVQYKYGSLPPVYQFVDHQVTVGLTFKAKYARNQLSVF